MNTQEFTNQDVIDSHNRSSASINDWARWISGIATGALSVLISMTVNIKISGVSLWLYQSTLISTGLGIFLIAIFLYQKATLGFKKADEIKKLIGEKKRPISVSIGGPYLFCVRFGLFLIAIGAAALIAFACINASKTT